MKNNLNEDLDGFYNPVMEAVESIKRYIQPEKVICFGYRVTGDDGERYGRSCGALIVCNILVLTGKHEKRRLKESLSLLRREFDSGVTVNWLLHQTESVKELLRAGQPFFCNVVRKGILLYDNGLALPPTEENTGAPMEDNGGDWSPSYELGREFQEVARFASGAGLYRLVSFNLHQALGQFGIAVLKTFIYYKLNTHNIIRMLDLLEMVSPEFKKIFPADTGEEIALLTTLRRAYADVRYSSGYSVSRDTAEILFERVGQFEGIMLRLKESELNACQNIIDVRAK